jgi:hypothetical protein
MQHYTFKSPLAPFCKVGNQADFNGSEFLTLTEAGLHAVRGSQQRTLAGTKRGYYSGSMKYEVRSP